MDERCGHGPLLLAALCADWCSVCRDYRAVFDAFAHEAGATADFIWIDVEDDEEMLGGLEVDDFPTLLIACGDEVRFFGPVRARPAVAAQLLQQAREGTLPPLADARLQALAARVRAAHAGSAGR